MATPKPRPAPQPDQFTSVSDDQFSCEDHVDALLLILPHEVESGRDGQGINTKHGAAEAVRVDILVVDGEHASESYRDALLFGKALCGQLTRHLAQVRSKRANSMLLGRLIRGAAPIDPDTGEVRVDIETGEPFNGAWKLTKATKEDENQARQALATKAATLKAV
ncbi:MAG: hypothetical protein ACREQ5_01495 [Candidatus Dormibacteria bacterium]